MLHILIPEEGQSWGALLRRLQKLDSEVLVVLSGGSEIPDLSDAEGFHEFLEECSKRGDVRIVSRRAHIIRPARERAIPVLDHIEDVRSFLAGNPAADEVIRLMNPHVWRQQLRSKLQSIGLLSLPRLRVWILIIVSAFLLFFVLFRLLPSAEVSIWPNGETITQTTNIILVQSGAVLDVPARVRTIELVPITVRDTRTITFDQISKEFIGERAKTSMTIFNESNEDYALRGGSRLVNEAGMIFIVEDPIFVKPGQQIQVKAEAADLDLYKEIIGARANLPANVQWNFINLPKEDQAVLYARNLSPITGGVSDYRTVLKQSDIDDAVVQLKSELLSRANQLVDDEILIHNDMFTKVHIDRLYYDEFTSATYSGFVLPSDFIGEPVKSVPVTGEIIYTAFAFDKQRALELLSKELHEHTGDGRELLEDTITIERLVYHVIDYADDISWIKLTADLTGKEEFVLDPLTPKGARFAKKVREAIKGKRKEEALRVLKNMPEVDEAKISIWPPWNASVPALSTQIVIEHM